MKDKKKNFEETKPIIKSLKKLGKAISSGIVKALPWVPTAACLTGGIVNGIIKNVDSFMLHSSIGIIIAIVTFPVTVHFTALKQSNNKQQKGICIREEENIYDFDNHEENNIVCVKNQEDDTLSFDEDINSKC